MVMIEWRIEHEDGSECIKIFTAYLIGSHMYTTSCSIFNINRKNLLVSLWVNFSNHKQAEELILKNDIKEYFMSRRGQWGG